MHFCCSNPTFPFLSLLLLVLFPFSTPDECTAGSTEEREATTESFGYLRFSCGIPKLIFSSLDIMILFIVFLGKDTIIL